MSTALLAESPKIEATAVYGDLTACAALGVGLSVLDRGRRDGGLRYSRRGSRNFYLGSWLLAWIEAGEIRSGDADQMSPAQDAAGV
jgi:hypothetical protein